MRRLWLGVLLLVSWNRPRYRSHLTSLPCSTQPVRCGTPSPFISAIVRVFVVMSVLTIGLARQASADVTYTYTGNPFTSFTGSYQCPPVCRITGSFTVTAPLPLNTDTFVSPVSFGFTDGLNTFSNSTSASYSIYVVTDTQGRITSWALLIFNQGALQLNLTINNFGSYTDVSGDIAGDSAVLMNSPGTWSSSLSAPQLTLTLDKDTTAPTQEENPLTSSIPPRLEQVTATATLSGSGVLSGQAVDFIADPDTLLLSGHDHYSGQASVGGDGFGDFASTASGQVPTCTTDSSAACSVTLMVPRFSGQYQVTARLTANHAVTDQHTVKVGVEYLTPAEAAAVGLSSVDVSFNTLAPDPSYVLTGAEGDRHCDGSPVISMHPSNHFGTDLLRTDLALIASKWLAEGNTLPIRINDMSLDEGGVFDVANDWSSDAHAAHRYGVNADIDWAAGANGMCLELTDTQKTELYRLILRVTGTPPAPEDPLTHWHMNHPIK